MTLHDDLMPDDIPDDEAYMLTERHAPASGADRGELYRDALTCNTCAETTGTTRYCARTRCYCGHPDCPAYDSYIDLAAIPLPTETTPKPRRKSTAWDDRKDATWLDKL